MKIRYLINEPNRLILPKEFNRDLDETHKRPKKYGYILSRKSLLKAPVEKSGFWGFNPIRVCFAIVFVLFFPFKTVATSFFVSPAQVRVTLPGDIQTTQIVTVQNNCQLPIRFKAYLVDWSQTETGADTWLEPGTLTRSCTPWIIINPIEFEVAPRAQQKIRVTINAPQGATGGYWCLLFIESAPIPNEWSKMAQINGRIGVRIYANIAKTETKACEITSLYFQKQSPLEIVTTIKNTSNIPISLAGEVQIVDSSNKTMWKDGLKSFILPELKRIIRNHPKIELKSGEYRVIVTVDYTGKEIVQGERKLKVN